LLEILYGEERSIACDCTLEEKMNVEGFTSNGCYCNQLHPPFEVLIYSIDANSSCSFTKYLTFKQRHLVSSVSVSFKAVNHSFDSQLLFSALFMGFIWKYPDFAPYPVDKLSSVT